MHLLADAVMRSLMGLLLIVFHHVRIRLSIASSFHAIVFSACAFSLHKYSMRRQQVRDRITFITGG